jgi:hypothetical protein
MLKKKKPDNLLLVGLDLGQTQDPTALSVVEKTHVEGMNEEGKPDWISHYLVRHLERVRLGTDYTEIAEWVAGLFEKPPLRGTQLIVDQTGVGRPVINMIRKHKPKCHVRPLTFTSGQRWTIQDGDFHVPKKDLVGIGRIMLEQGRLRIASSLPDAQVLAAELKNLRVKISTAANAVGGGWRESMHDDLAFSVIMAIWVGEYANRKLMIAC